MTHLVLVLASLCPGQSASPLYADIKLHDGSLIRMQILQEALDVQTKYGKLRVPCAEIRAIDFGLHVPGELASQIGRDVELLGAAAFRQREDASRRLSATGYWAFPALQQAAQSDNVEVAMRAGALTQRMTACYSPETLARKDKDAIQTLRFKVVGVILTELIRVSSPVLGDRSLAVHDLASLATRGRPCTDELVIEARGCGSDPPWWFNTNIVLDSQLRLSIKATGQVDVYPQEPGQYLSTPVGIHLTGRDTPLPAGALVGRIGEQGRPFVVGSWYQGAQNEQGLLYLRIVPSPWNNASAGCYRVSVKTEHVVMTSRRD